MDTKKVRYKSKLNRELREAEQAYKGTLHTYETTSITDPLWEKVRRNRDNKYLNKLTAESRLKKLNRDSSVEEYRVDN